jgi:hypothetical protein
MLTPGHVAISYLISQFPIRSKGKLSSSDILFIIFCGNVLDLDFLLPPLFGYPGGIHHHFPTHTPLFGIILLITLFLLTKNKFSSRVFFLAGLAIIGHLILDDLGYWIVLVGVDKHTPTSPQILWEWPFNFSNRKMSLLTALENFRQHPTTNIDIISIYLNSKLFVVEIITILTAIIFFTKNHFRIKASNS